MKFTKLGLDPQILKALDSIGFETATEVQLKTIPYVLKGKDVTVRSQTGSGKTFAYILPLIQNIDYNDPNIQVLVVCPTRELSLQVKEEVDKLKKHMARLNVVPIYGGSDIQRQISGLKKKPQIVIGTPGRLLDHINRKTLKLHTIKAVVLDEADEMLNMGFKDDMEDILKHTQKDRQTLMFSATYSKEILELTANYQNNPVKIEIGEDKKSLDNIKQYYINVNRNEKMDAIIKLFNKNAPQKAIIFTNTKIMAQNLSDFLNKNGYFSQSLHGDLRQSTRKKVINEIKTDKVSILVASDVAARGLDINDVDYVINYDLPNNVEYFLHRIGRTARAGKNGNAVTFITNKTQLNILKDYEKLTNSTMSELSLGLTFTGANDKQGKNERSRSRSGSRTSDRSSDRNSSRSGDRKTTSRESSRDRQPQRDTERTAKPRRERSFSSFDKPQRDTYKKDTFAAKQPNFSNENLNVEELDAWYEEKTAKKSSFSKTGSFGKSRFSANKKPFGNSDRRTSSNSTSRTSERSFEKPSFGSRQRTGESRTFRTFDNAERSSDRTYGNTTKSNDRPYSTNSDKPRDRFTKKTKDGDFAGAKSYKKDNFSPSDKPFRSNGSKGKPFGSKRTSSDNFARNEFGTVERKESGFKKTGSSKTGKFSKNNSSSDKPKRGFGFKKKY